MAQKDKERWDEKYSHPNHIPDTPTLLVETYAALAPAKQALDIACGMGRHAKYLACLGFEVDALDISSVALDHLACFAHIHPREVDFDTYVLPANRYDLIVCTYFLERRLFPQMIQALNPRGVLLFETFVHNPENERTPSNPDFLLNEGELENYFEHTCEIIHLNRWWDKDYTGAKVKKISIVVRKKQRRVCEETQ